MFAMTASTKSRPQETRPARDEERTLARSERIPHPDAATLDLATIMRTLGDPVRLDIVRALADDQPRSCNEIAESLEMPMSTCSYHLRLLREAGVTRTRADGTRRFVSLRRDDLDAQFPGLTDVITR